MRITRKMTIFKEKAFRIWITFSLHLILLTIRIDAAEHKVTCKKSVKPPHINDVYYEFIAADDCDENDSETGNDSIFPTAVLSGSLNVNSQATQQHHVGTQFLHDFDSSSIRKPRSEQTDDIVPTNVFKMNSQHTTNADGSAEERQNNPNADIQDIITGIVKLLNGNVNLQANTQYTPTTLRRFATRINNRGPPRIPDYPVVVPVVDIKTTPYPSGMRKPPTVPYPFDLPPPPPAPVPEKPLRTEHTVIMHNNKPIQPNRPPWHGSRTRPPIQITNTNRMQMPSRLAHQPTQDYRPPSKTVNPMTTPSTRIPDLIKSPDLYPSEKPSLSLLPPPIIPNIGQSEPAPKETTTKKTDPSPAKKISKPVSSTTSSSVETTNVAPEPPVSVQTSISPTITLEKTSETALPVTQITPITTSAATSDETQQLPIPPSTHDVYDHVDSEMQTTESIQSSIESTISPSRVTRPSQPIESTDFKSFYARPGIVLDDTDFKPGQLEPSTPAFRPTHRPSASVQSSASLSNIFAEIFDVTLSAIQGQPGGHHKVVDLIEIGNTGSDAPDVIATRYGVDGNDIIVSASDDNSFVSIDGKRTYINLFGETAETEHLKNPLKTQSDHGIYQQSTKTVTPFAEKTNSIPLHRKPSTNSKPLANTTSRPYLPPSMIHRKPPQNAIRIDTCIVGDDSTCDIAQNEVCKTDLGVSSCHCRPGYSRRKYRDPCRRVVSLLMSMRIDKYYDKPIVWDQVFGDANSEQFKHMSYETMRAVDSVMSMTPFSDDFISARVHNIYTGNASQGSPGVYVNITIQLDGNTESARKYIQSDLQKELIAVIHRRNNNIGNSALFVEQPAGSISSLHDLDECSSAELNDCHVNANCSNTWGAFECQCMSGLRDPWSDQRQRAGRECISCSNSYCNNRGTCQYDESGTQLVCVCVNSYYGSQCEIDGDILAVSVGASIIAVLIITLTLICLVMWGRKWNQEQKEMIGSPIFNYITRANFDSHMKTMQSKTYQAALEDRMRWAQIADVMAQSNHYAVEPVAPQRIPAAPMYGYQNMMHPSSTANLTSLSMAGTLPVRSRMGEISLPVSRMDMESTSKMRRHENTSSSEEDDLVDLLGNTYQSPTGIYYDVDCESSDQQHGSSTLQSNLDNGGPLYSLSNPPRVPMSTYSPNSRMYPRN